MPCEICQCACSELYGASTIEVLVPFNKKHVLKYIFNFNFHLLPELRPSLASYVHLRTTQNHPIDDLTTDKLVIPRPAEEA